MFVERVNFNREKKTKKFNKIEFGEYTELLTKEEIQLMHSVEFYGEYYRIIVCLENGNRICFTSDSNEKLESCYITLIELFKNQGAE